MLRRWSAFVLLLSTGVACAYHSPAAPTAVTTQIADNVPFTVSLGANVTTGSAIVSAKVQNVSGVPMNGIVVLFSSTVGTLSAAAVQTDTGGVATTTITTSASTTITATAGNVTSRVLVTPTAPTQTPPTTTPAPPAPDPTPAPTPAPLTVTLLATARQAGLTTDFSLATQALRSAIWTFGDGSASISTSTPFTSHVYALGGNYTAGVTVTDTLGRSASTSTIVAVPSAPLPPAPPAGFTATVSCSKSAPLTAACNVAATSNGAQVQSNSITKTTWDWGDGQTDLVLSPVNVHKYANLGTYTVFTTVSATVADGSTQMSTTSTTVTVTP